MMRFLVMLIGLVPVTGFAMHPSLDTVTEVQWNDQTHVVEVALRLTSVDEQDVVDDFRSRYEPQTAGEETWSDVRRHTEIVRRTVHFDTDPAETAELSSREHYRWIGRQVDGGHVWWFFEYAFLDEAGERRRVPPRTLSIRILDRLAAGHVHDGKQVEHLQPQNVIRVLGGTDSRVESVLGHQRWKIPWPTN